MATRLRAVEDNARRPLPVREPGAIERVLSAARDYLGMETAFISRVSNGKVVIQYADQGSARLLEVGDRFPSEDSYCQRILDGRLPYLVADTSRNAEAQRIEATRRMPIGAHLGVPLKLSNGQVYGTFCCFSRRPDTSLDANDLEALKLFARLAAGQIEAELAAESAA